MNMSFGAGARSAAAVVVAGAAIWTASAATTSDDEGYADICVGQDRVLRVADSEGCPDGEKRLKLSSWKPEKADEQQAKEDEPEKKKGEPARNRVTAPFEVVDRAGNVILRVTEGDADTGGRGAYLYRSGQPVIVLGTTGPSLLLSNDGASPGVWLGIKDEGAGFLDVYRADGVAAELGPGSANNTALRIYGEAGKPLAAIGIDAAGNGAVRVGDSSGSQVAGMAADSDGGGSIVAYHKSGQPAAALAIGDGGVGSIQTYSNGGQVLGSLTQGVNGGKLQLNDLGGEPMVEAGTLGSVGIVKTGPMTRASGILGIPGSYIKGGQ